MADHASSRGLVDGLASPLPLIERLPGLMQGDDFTRRFVEAFDDSLAPVIATIDGLAGYVDPWLAPEDFLDWLAGWVGVELDDAWDTEQRREIVAGAAVVHRRRGTLRGVAEALERAFGCEVSVSDSGGVAWSLTPGADAPGSSPPHLSVELRVADPDGLDLRRVERLIESVKPAHVPYTLEIAAADAPSGGTD